MQAHHNHTHPVRYHLLTLTLCCLTAWFAGCNSSETTEYRQFSEDVDSKTAQTDEPAPSDQTEPDVKAEQQTSPSEKEVIQQTAAVKPAQPMPPELETPTASESQAETKPQPVGNLPEQSLPVAARKPDPAQRALSKEEEQALVKQEPREVKILVKNKSFRHVSPGNVLQVSYDDIDLLKVMNMEPVTAEAPELMPQWLKDLDGKRIRIRGFMYPPFQQTGNEFFLLARDNQICCFGKNPKIYDLFPVVLRDGVTTDYILNRPFDVVGVFHIKAETVDDELERIYMIDDAIVIDQ